MAFILDYSAQSNYVHLTILINEKSAISSR